MDKEINIKEMIGSIEGISKLAKSISHPKRLQLLILLEEEDRNFSTLINRTNLKKTALSNHLTLLITNHLVQKSGRGNYQITTDGLELLKATTRVYEKSKSREKFNREKLRKQYSNVRMKMIEKSENLISQDPKMEGAWISYIGAVLGVL
ncbi:MAG: ArsR family transcriptional regulator, partial [Promethearchaeota archaeon]